MGKLKKEFKSSTLFRISIIISLVGWFPFMILAVMADIWSPNVQVIILCLGLFGCMIGPVLSITMTRNPIFWANYEELEKLKEAYIKSKAQYDKALNKFVENQNIKDE